ncbi:MAG: hypothetical protein ACRDWI_09790 [Jiangellaceae bacterium]
MPPDPVHAHLRHREVPNQDVLRPAHWALRIWAAISVSVLLLAMAALIIVDVDSTYAWLVGVVVVVVGIEAAIQGRLIPFLAALVVILLLGTGTYLAVANLRLGIALAHVFAAVALLLSNFLGYLRRR